jgi:hypothetical protein
VRSWSSPSTLNTVSAIILTVCRVVEPKGLIFTSVERSRNPRLYLDPTRPPKLDI